MSAELAVFDLVAGYAVDVPIVRGLTLEVRANEIVTVLGPNGAGKSTFIKAVAGLVAVHSGTVLLRGRPITGIATHQLVREGLAYVPQVGNIFVRLTVTENLELGGLMAKADTRRQMDAIFALFPDLAAQRSRAAGRLSGGQRQMVAVGRALMSKPRLLMLDEPSAGLSPKLTETLFQKLLEIRAGGVTILMVEQNAKAALAISDRGYVLAEGRQVFTGAARELLTSPEIGELYLGARKQLAP